MTEEVLLTGLSPPPSAASALTPLARLADISEEDIWLAKQKSKRTRRAYKLDVTHFMRTLMIRSYDELRQIDHRAVIAWERIMREVDGAAPSTALHPLELKFQEASLYFVIRCTNALRVMLQGIRHKQIELESQTLYGLGVLKHLFYRIVRDLTRAEYTDGDGLLASQGTTRWTEDLIHRPGAAECLEGSRQVFLQRRNPSLWLGAIATLRS